jgi:hypothetical protein
VQALRGGRGVQRGALIGSAAERYSCVEIGPRLAGLEFASIMPDPKPARRRGLSDWARQLGAAWLRGQKPCDGRALSGDAKPCQSHLAAPTERPFRLRLLPERTAQPAEGKTGHA